MVVEITRYFTKLAKRYYSSLFHPIWNQKSIFSYLSEIYMKNISPNFVHFMEEVYKCNFDEEKKLLDEEQ